MTGHASRLDGRLGWLPRIVAVSIAIVCSACAGEPERRVDQVILISIDTLRADYLGVYGAPSGITPALDAFAGTAVVFDDAITQATSTLLSHTSLFYSMHTFVHHAVTGSPPDPQLESPVETLRQAGFRTAAYGGDAP
jgi:arylsulfatase A-like enzyme